ncbi:ac132 [Choristoneura murinana nucleopolyhedrovirus]|uniref:Ac132 n=1 Tax=Choristoneura murinana nucleopolyhedrovirus TaxID=1987479 RepID=V9XPR8_9ABAC|nr:ac132 [Choristoneura murinana nucleopolyhedrovirus]AHD25512.1 ac132 [Choristoneura murinana nucleopolyhedrovirus]
MPKNEKPYSRQSTVKAEQVKITERSNQFKAASNKYGKRVGEPDKETRLVAFVNIKLNNEATPEMNRQSKIVYEQQKPSIFNKANVEAFIQKCTFVVAFAHPTYSIEYNKISQTNLLKIYCMNINSELLFKNKNEQMLNALPHAAAFRVQINNELPSKVENVMYDKQTEQLILSVYFSPKQTMESLPLKKCVIYFNTLSTTEWSVPSDLLRAFANLPLTQPKFAPQNN